MAYDSETVWLEGIVNFATRKAMLVEPTIGAENWVPRSQVVSMTEKGPGEFGTLFDFEVFAWIARKNGFLD